MRWCVALSAVFALGACTMSSVEPNGVVPVEGRWSYQAQESAGTTSVMDGTLILRSRSAISYAGDATWLATTADGTQRREIGVVSGRMAGTATVDFSVATGMRTLQHVAQWRGDTMTGTWLELEASGLVRSSGTFRAVRTTLVP